MIIRFSKYQGTGNDFIMIDNRSSVFRTPEKSIDLIALLCHRKFGIGADGLILINQCKDADFEMKYFNADGKEGTMCGNGGRCSVAFASNLGMIKEKTSFMAIDGLHEATILKKGTNNTSIKLKMQDVQGIMKQDNAFIINTGSPHYISFREDVRNIDVFTEGRNIRYSSAFKEHGINVNFVEAENGQLFVRTYERGVEDETLSCGTGVTAAALAASLSGLCGEKSSCAIETLGGNLMVHFNKISDTSFSDIWLEGPTVNVFKGEFNV